MKKIFLLLLFACPSLHSAELVDRIVAVVGNEIITFSDVRTLERKGAKDPLNSLIRERVLQIEMERFKIDVTDEDTARAVYQVLARNRMTLEELKRELTQKGISFDSYKEGLKVEIRRMKFMEQVVLPRIRISEEEIAKKLGPKPTDEERARARHELIEARLGQELENYLDEVRKKTYVEIKK